MQQQVQNDILGSRLTACCELAPTLASHIWRHNYVITHQPQWISNFYIVTIYRSLGIFTAFFKIHTSFMEIWKKMWMGVFSWTQCSIKILHCVSTLNKKAQLSLTNPRDAKACKKLLQFDVLTTLSLTILVYLHSISCCCVRNLRNPEKFSENSNL